MTVRTEQLTRERNEIERRKVIVVGLGVVVFDVGVMGWAIPGGLHTTHKPAAERAARLIDMMSKGEIPGPRILRGER